MKLNTCDESVRNGPLPEPVSLVDWHDERKHISAAIKAKAEDSGVLEILEAGCGTGWGTDLGGVQYVLTGVDLDEAALRIRKDQQKDLHIAIRGDLRTVQMESGKYDVIYNSWVLEHVSGAEEVLNNFIRWLKPGGILILLIPDRDSARGFITRITPFWIHVFYSKYIEGNKYAGQEGYAPYPTVYDKVVSRIGIHQFCKAHGLDIKGEYSIGHGRSRTAFYRFLNWGFHTVGYIASLGRLSAKHCSLMYVIEKPR